LARRARGKKGPLRRAFFAIGGVPYLSFGQ
jgi:hypothetical protein